MVQTVVFLLLCLCLTCTSQAQVSLLSHELGKDVTATLQLEPQPHFSVAGLAEPSVELGSEIFKITVQTDQTHVPALLGHYELTSPGTLSFFPRYPLSKSVEYRLSAGPQLQRQLVGVKSEANGSLLFQLPREPPQRSTIVSAIYPSAAELPENLLKFYIHFSAPMSRGQAYEHIQLLQGDEVVEQPFLELGEELWDGEQTRFTLFIHPGRIKHGLRSRDEAGPSLTAGRKYTLRINQAWMDAGGFKLGDKFEKQFAVVASDDEQLDPQKWKIESPSTHTAPVVLAFDEPLDHALLTRVLEVKHRDGSTIPGTVELADHESKWVFTPKKPWGTGTYSIEVATLLEDLSGNSLAKPFEAKMQLPTPEQPPRVIAIEFIVK